MTQPIPTPEGASPQGDADASGGIPVPLSALAQPDDKEQMQTPAEGDIVQLQVEATVVSIQGDTAIIKPTSINGNPLDEEGESPDNESQEMDSGGAESALRDAMGQQPPQ